MDNHTKAGISLEYKELAAQLGDIQYRRRVLDAREAIIMSKMDVLNKKLEQAKIDAKNENKNKKA